MKPLRQIKGLVLCLGTNTSPWIIVAAFLDLNVYWTVLLGVLDEQFRETIGGLPLLDLQNSLAPGRSPRPLGC